jgi:hypothetical protein
VQHRLERVGCERIGLTGALDRDFGQEPNLGGPPSQSDPDAVAALHRFCFARDEFGGQVHLTAVARKART